MPATLTPLHAALAIGRAALIQSAAFEVEYRGETIRALVNETPTDNWKNGSMGVKGQKTNFLPKDYVTIDISNEVFGDEDPRVGESLERDGETRYRVEELQSFELFWRLLCKCSVIE